jgi:hypothetical protein
MPHIDSNRRPLAASAIVLALLLACLGLTACGGSSKGSSSTAATNAAATSTSTTGTSGPTTGTSGTTSPTGKGPAATNSGRFAALRECLQKNGITLPKRTPGQQRPGGAGGFLGGGAAGPQLPKGVTRAQYEAALKKCGGNAFAGGARRRFNSPTFKTALAKFATCMRENGVNIPAPNTSGSGPIFNTKGIDTASTQFKTAETKCSSDLRAGFRGGAGAKGAPGAPGRAGANGAPGSAAPPAESAG